MKAKIISLFLGVVLVCSAILTFSASEPEYSKLFEKDHILKIEVTLSESDFQSILDNPTAEEYKSATVTVDGETVENAGFRTKGNLSLKSVAKSDSDRYSFRIKFDKYVKGQRLLGLDEMVVNNMYSDPSYLREYLSYEAMRENGAPVPETTFANIYINGELYGFYLCVEAIDDSFLERVFGDNDGNLYKQEMGSSLLYEEGSDYPQSELKNGDDTEKTGLKNMIKVLNEMPDGEKGGIEEVLDVESALQYIAANTVLGNYDSYNGSNLQNFYLYEQNGKFYVIPWDYNMSFNGYGGGASAQTIPTDEPVMNVSMEKTPLIRNLLEVDEYKERYHEIIRDYLNTLQNFESRVSELAAKIRPYVEADPTKFYTMEQFENATTYQEETGEAGQQPGMMPQPPEGTDGNQPPEMPQMPDGMDENKRPEMPEFSEAMNGKQSMAPPDNDGNPPPQGERNENQNASGENPFSRPGGETNNENAAVPTGKPGDRNGGMMTANSSILNFVRARVENIEKQLSGELPTTGNTTVNSSGGRPGGMGNRPEAADGIHVRVNGKPLRFAEQPFLQEDRTMVPFRAIFEALGVSVNWDKTAETVTAKKEDVTLTLKIGEKQAYKNQEEITMDVPAMLKNDRTFVPVRFLAESFGLTVEWEEQTQTVLIQE